LNILPLEEKQVFAFDIIALAYGEAVAKQALGFTPTQQTQLSNSGKGRSYSSGDGTYVSDGNCSYFSTDAGSISTCD